MSCPFKNIFGKVGEGVHSIRVYDIAIIDIFLVILAGYLIHLCVPQYNVYKIISGLFILGIIMHRLFCARTTIDKLLFP